MASSKRDTEPDKTGVGYDARRFVWLARFLGARQQVGKSG